MPFQGRLFNTNSGGSRNTDSRVNRADTDIPLNFLWNIRINHQAKEVPLPEAWGGAAGFPENKTAAIPIGSLPFSF
jgi:hypothetical protein